MSEAYALSETHRLLANLIRIGTITDLDVENAKVKVRVAGSVTDWMPWVTSRAGPVRNWNPPRPGEQVVILAPYGDIAQAVVLPSLYRDKYPKPDGTKYTQSTVFPDGTIVAYDTSTNTVNVTVAGDGKVIVNCKEATIKATTKITLDTPNVKVTGDVEADGDVKAGTVSLKNHTHKNVQSGSSNTGTPNT